MKIDKNIPIPERSSKQGSKYKFLHDLEIMDSFWVETIAQACQVQSYAHRTTNIRLTQRADGTGRRLWRVK